MANQYVSYPALGDPNAIDALTGDVSATGPGSATATVNSVGGSTAADVHSATVLALAATNLDTNSAIVKRDSSGNFNASSISLTTALNLPNGSLGTPSINFGSSNAGIFADPTTGGIAFVPNIGAGSRAAEFTTDGTRSLLTFFGAGDTLSSWIENGTASTGRMSFNSVGDTQYFYTSRKGTASLNMEMYDDHAGNGTVLVGNDLVASNGNNGAQLTPTSTQGFLYLNGMNGAPTGSPAQTSSVQIPLVVDTANKKLWCKIGGTWVGVALA